jgi:hypothetical protein
MTDHIFVFGSNLAGRHGAGAALHAAKHYGAERGVGKGPTGKAYAIPTKDEWLRTLPLDLIARSYADFWDYATARPQVQFLLTPFGAGLAGYSTAQMRQIVERHPYARNIWFTGDWFA